jgi:ribosomal protein L37E
VHEEFITCRECGKELPADLNVCPECGYVRRRTRATREKERRAIEPASSQVAAVTDAVRSVPRRETPRRESGGRRAKSRHRPPEDRPASSASRRASRYSDRVAARPPRPGTGDVAAADSEGAPEGVRSLARRKVYRYGPEKRRRFAFAGEIRALVILLVVGLCLVLMCRVQQSNAAPERPAPEIVVPAPHI